ncbi:MAG: DNA polymerase Y family protein [bacterium]|nr:DNA polymerase Y family protein [bacterium]
MRIACLFAPLFVLAARLRSEPNLRGEAVAVCEGNGTTARIMAASRPSRQAGIRAGMTLVQARGIMPSLIARGRDSTCERSAHEALLEISWTLSPQVEATADDQIFSDVSGMDGLYPGKIGEETMGREAIAVADSLHLPIRVGIASNKLAAQIASSLPQSPVVVDAGDEAAFLAPLPLSHLQLEGRTASTLQRWGITRIGDLARLPADRVSARLGSDGLVAHRAACGVDHRPLVPHRPPPVLTEGMELEWPVVTIEPLLFAVRQSLDRLHRRLTRQELACSLLELELDLEPEGTERHTIGLPAPTRDVDALLALIRLELESRPPQSAIAAFRCMVTPDAPRRGQLTLFGPEDVHPQKLATALARLAARLGPDRVGSPRVAEGHCPESYGHVNFEPPPTPRFERSPEKVGRGLLTVRVLRPPVELEVITDAPLEMTTSLPDSGGDPPISTDSKNHRRIRLTSIASLTGEKPRIQGLVRIASGPWQLEDGWWSDRPVQREYWDIELSDGGLYRIYRDRNSGSWFADGLYD